MAETRRSPVLGLAAVLSAAALAVSACAGEQPPEPASSESVTVDEEPLASFYDQPFAWGQCED